jgi:hypothetical protein
MTAMPHFIVEYAFDPPLSDADFNGASARLKPCLEMRNIRRLRTWLADDRMRMLCEYEAADAQTVREAYRSAQVQYARVWSAKLYEAAPPVAG